MAPSYSNLKTALALFITLALTGCGVAQRESSADAPRRGMVATVHPLATQAGLDALKRGGNAIDAAVAAALTLGVVDGFNSGIGGGCFILIRTADGELRAIDGRETAPALATRDMFLRNGVADAQLSQTGALAVGTPGSLAAYELAVKEFGRLHLADPLLRAADIADMGFTLDSYYARRIADTAPKLAKFDGSRGVFFSADGSPLREGDVLRQPELGNTYKQIAAHGTRFFYEGPFAQAVDEWMRGNGGVLRAEDFATYRPVVREPLVTDYRGYTIIGFPPPSSGGVHVAQILNILENFDLVSIHERDPAQAAHLIAESMKLAFADRAYWLGDPAFADVPRGLIDEGYAKSLADRIDPHRAIVVESHGEPPGEEWFGKSEISNLRSEINRHTTHIAVADSDGNWVAITATINTTFGSGVIVPGTGVVLNNQMDDFAAAPGVPNAYGLLGAEANSVAPGKRPLSSMSPTIVLKDGRPMLTIGAAGGPRIITQAVLGIVRTLDYAMTLEEAVTSPRIHHQWRPDAVFVEAGFDPSLVDALRARGHEVRISESGGVTQAIVWDRRRGLFVGVADGRANGLAVGW